MAVYLTAFSFTFKFYLFGFCLFVIVLLLLGFLGEFKKKKKKKEDYCCFFPELNKIFNYVGVSSKVLIL